VTESLHLIDVLNQYDLVENTDTEDKLGQPMINFSIVTDVGVFDFFVLAGFRERTFPGEEGRLRGPLVIDNDEALFERANDEKDIDYAVRWSHTMGSVDVGLYVFSGTNREPWLEPRLNGDGELVFIPHYDLMDQVGLDLQWSIGNWAWKLEALYRNQDQENVTALVGGFEYTLGNFMESSVDLGLLTEYQYDDREDVSVAGQDDIFLGVRLGFSDVQSSELLAGVVIDTDDDTSLYRIEGSRRFGSNWKVFLELQGVTNADPANRLYVIREDDYVQLEVLRYF